jgi:hypothetical protein
MKKANQFLTVALIFLLIGYFSEKTEGLIAVSLVIVGIFWGISFIAMLIDEDD